MKFALKLFLLFLLPIAMFARSQSAIITLSTSSSSVSLGGSVTIGISYTWGTSSWHEDMDLYIDGVFIQSYFGGLSDRSFSYVYTPTSAGNHEVVLDIDFGSETRSLTVTATGTPVTFSFSPTTFTYNGGVQGPSVSPSIGGATYSTSGTTSAVAAGTYSMGAAGTGAYTGSGSTDWTILPTGQTVDVSPTSQTITAGDSITFNASGGNNGYVWGGSAGGSGASQTVSFPAAGTFSVTVYSPSGGNWNQSNTATATITVNPATTPISSVSAATSTYSGAAQSPALSSNPGGATYGWNVVGGTSSTTATGAGTYNVSWAGTGSYTGSGTASWTIQKANQSAISITSAASTTYGASYTATASGGNGSGGIVWALGSGSTAAGAAINSSTGEVTALSAGTVVIVAFRAADSNYNQSSSTANFTVTFAQRAATITLSGTRAYNGTNNLSGGISASAAGLASGDSLSAIAATSGSPGTYTTGTSLVLRNGSSTDVTSSYTVTYAGSYVITKANQGTVSISPTAQTIVAGNSISFSASGGSTGTYAWGGTSGATGGGTPKSVTFATAGSFTVTTQDSGDTNYNASNVATATITVNPAISTYSSAGSLAIGSAYVSAVQATRDGQPTSRTANLTISNTGNINMNVTGISFSGTNPTEFSVSAMNGGAVTYPLVVAAGGSVTITVRFAPTGVASAVGSRSATMTVTNSSSNSPSATVTVSGTGQGGVLATSAGALRSLP